jgi:hypothetical protein
VGKKAWHDLQDADTEGSPERLFSNWSRWVKRHLAFSLLDKKDRTMTMAATPHLLARDDEAIRRRLDLPTPEAMRDSLNLVGKARR